MLALKQSDIVQDIGNLNALLATWASSRLSGHMPVRY
jgi:hypothetical protein